MKKNTSTMSISRILRPRQCEPPKFSLTFTPRPLVPLEQLHADKEGYTTYGISPSQGSASTSSSSSPMSCGGGRSMSSFGGTNAYTRATPIIPALLYLGDSTDATPQALAAIGIKHVLNVAAECEVRAYGQEIITTRHLHLQDHSDEDIQSELNDIVEYMRHIIEDLQEPLLVHCRHGISRSAAVVIAFLIRHGLGEHDKCDMSYEEAFQYVKTRRPLVSPNLGFVLALQEWALLQHVNAMAKGWLEN